MPRGKLDLDVDAPDEVATVLLNAVESYYESAVELRSAWQDESAGRPWEKIAKILEVAAYKIQKAGF